MLLELGDQKRERLQTEAADQYGLSQNVFVNRDQNFGARGILVKIENRIQGEKLERVMMERTWCGRTRAQVVVGQAEFADIAVLNRPNPIVAAVLRRLSPRARISVGADGIEYALGNLYRDARRGRSDDPYGPLLAGQPPLDSRGPVKLVEFNARRPFHPQRLHDSLDLLLEGVIRTRGRLWLASQPDHAMWLESAGAGLRVSSAGKWLAALTGSELAGIGAERRAFAELTWDDQYGDRHTSMTVLVCGANGADILDALNGALLTDDEFRFPRYWTSYDDPFGDWHEDPCAALGEAAENPPARHSQDGDR